MAKSLASGSETVSGGVCGFECQADVSQSQTTSVRLWLSLLRRVISRCSTLLQRSGCCISSARLMKGQLAV